MADGDHCKTCIVKEYFDKSFTADVDLKSRFDFLEEAFKKCKHFPKPDFFDKVLVDLGFNGRQTIIGEGILTFENLFPYAQNALQDTFFGVNPFSKLALEEIYSAISKNLINQMDACGKFKEGSCEPEEDDKKSNLTNFRCKNLREILKELDVRSRNVIKKSLKVKSIEEFLLLNEDMIRNAKNAGEKTIERILKIQKDLETSPKVREYVELDIQVPCIDEILQNKSLKILEKDILKEYFSQLDARSKRVLEVNSIKTIEEILRLGDTEIRSFRSAGELTIKRILKSKVSLLMIANEHLKENLTLTDKVNACNPFEKYSFIQKLELYCNLYNSLSRRSKNVLMKNGIDRIDKLLGHNFSSILALKNAGRKTAEEIILKFEKLCHVPEKYLENSANGKYVFDKAFFNFLENLSERAKNVVFNYDLNKIEVLANQNFSTLLALDGVGKKKAEEIFRKFEKLILDPKSFAGNFEPCSGTNVDLEINLFDFEDPIKSINVFIEKTIKNPKHQLVVKNRYGVGINVKSLDGTGKLIGVTRERARQIGVECSKKLFHPLNRKKISLLLSKSGEIIDSFNNQIDFEVFISLLFGNNEEALAFFKHSRPFFSIYFPNAFGSSKEETKSIENKYPKALIDFFVELCKKNSSFNHLEESFWCLPLETFERKLADNQEKLKDIYPNFSLSKPLILGIISASRGEIEVKKRQLYSKSFFLTKYGKLGEACDCFLLNFPDGIHFEDFAWRFNNLRQGKKKISSRAIHGTLTRIENSVLIKRGFFLHSNFLPNPGLILLDIENRIIEHLEDSSYPFVSVKLFFYDFEMELKNAGITTPFMLYYLLKRKTEKIVFAKVPYLYLKDNFDGRILLNDLFENMFYEAGKPLTIKFVHNELKNKIGIQPIQFDLMQSKIPQIVRIDDSLYSHLAHIDYDKDGLLQILEHCSMMVQKERFVSVEKVFKEKIVLCKKSGIDSPFCLFYIIKSLFQLDEIEIPFSMTDYPHLSILKDDENIFSIKNALTAFVKDYGMPCPMNLILEHFSKKGVKLNTVRNTFHQISALIRYDTDCFVHKDSIGLTQEVFERVETHGLSWWKREKINGKLFGLISNLIEEVDCEVPLKNDFAWTNQLLFEILKRSRLFTVIGTAKEAYLPKKNDLNISNLTDLIVYYLKNNFNGAVDVSHLEGFLCSEKVIQKRIPKAIFSDTHAIVLNGNQIFLKELYECLKT